MENELPFVPTDPNQREMLMKALEHSVSRYDLYGKHVPLPFEKENLLEVISQRERYVIDNNSAWQSECKAHLDKAFIIPPALSREQTNTIALILDETRGKLGNIFTVGVHPATGLVLVDRIDESFVHTFNMEKLQESSRGQGEIHALEKQKEFLSNEHHKQVIRTIINQCIKLETRLGSPKIETHFPSSGKASELPMPKSATHLAARLKLEIQNSLPECRHNLEVSNQVSQLCYATLLLEDRQIRTEFDKSNYDNVFGDMNVLSIAVYINANILTGDKPLKRMASYVNLQCLKTLSAQAKTA